MLNLWGRINSINVQKVLWALDELKVPYERSDAGMQFGVVNEPFYRKMNPNGRVPTIEDDGFVLWESNAIVRYLSAEAEKVAQAFQVLDQSLEGRDHVAGKSFTMGDIPLGTFVHRWYALAVKRPKLARVEAYYQRLQHRASYKKHVMLPLS
jgi:glutathione S-transferase